MEYSSKGTKRVKDSNNDNKKHDKYYTNANIVDGLIEVLKKLFNDHNMDLNKYIFLEPCAGGGAFLDGLERNLPGTKYKAFDILPEDSRIEKANFLEIDHKFNKKLISIGNPPFGYKGDLAKAFINKCSEWGPVVAFVLPIQFRRYNIQKLLNADLKLIYSSSDLPKKSFTLEGKPFDVRSMYQVWVTKQSGLFSDMEDLRLLHALPNKHEDFRLFIHNNTVDTLKYFDKSKYEWDFAVARQGFYDYSERITDPAKLKPHIQYLFVKYVNPVSKEVFNKIDFAKLSHSNTSVLGFSNTDVVAEYIRIKKENNL